MQTLPEIYGGPDDFAEASRERARMGKIAGGLWVFAAVIGAICVFLPGSHHAAMPLSLGLAGAVFVYGFASLVGWIPWARASIDVLGLGMAFSLPVTAYGIYLTGGSLSFIEPLLVCTLFYAAFYFPERWAWPLTIEVIGIAGGPLLYDPEAIHNAFLPRYVALTGGFLVATWLTVGLKKRLLAAEGRQRDFANRDPLTGVGNRRFFDEMMQRELGARTGPFGRRGPDDSPLALLILDLDDFKGVNDRHGHQVGDTVLQEATARALSVLRSTDTLARIGGDEFAIIAPGARGENAAAVADTVRQAVSVGGADIDLPTPTVSVGWAVFPDDGGRDFETLMHSADERMMRIKRSDPRRGDSAIL